jgi:hypothetical protein
MKRSMTVWIFLFGIVFITPFTPLNTTAAVPLQITYQGQLTDTEGNPVPDGDYEMAFALYDVPTGGSALWSEAQSVTVINGIYTVILGQPGNELKPIHFTHDRYVGVTVGTDSEMTPRQPVTSVAYALRAGVANMVATGGVTTIMIEDGAVTSPKVADNAITQSKLVNASVTPAKIQDGATLLEITDDDGSGSGLDADLLDGLDSSAFMPAGVDNWVNEVGDTMTGKLEISVESGDGLSSTTLSSSAGSRGVYGYASGTTGYVSGVLGRSDSTSGTGVYGHATASTGTTHGVYGYSYSTSGYGVYGTAPTYGLYGSATATSGTTFGVWGRSASTAGRGVFGWASAGSDETSGVYGQSDSDEGRGVYGHATATSGETCGVWGQSDSTSGRGVYGVATASTSSGTYGVYGQSAGTYGIGVYGTAPQGGVRGIASASSGTTYGVFGLSNSTNGRGVYGGATAESGETYGVYGHNESNDGCGVRGVSTGTEGTGVHGYGGAYGVYGEVWRSSGTAVLGYANHAENCYGVSGISETSSGIGIYGLGGVHGVYGRSDAQGGEGVYGWATGIFTTTGVRGRSDSTSGRGVYGYATATTGYTYGVRGQSDSTSGRAVYGACSQSSGYDFYAGGAGANYLPFTGAHETKLSPDFPEEVEPGLIVAATGQAQIRQNPDGSVNLSSTLPTVKLADTPHDKAVFGVLVAEASLPEDHWYEAQEGERFASVNALGEGRVWVADINGAIEAGDYITTSSIPGYGQKQADDLLHSYTLGKAIETVDWDQVTGMVEIDGKAYKVYLIAVVYMSG